MSTIDKTQQDAEKRVAALEAVKLIKNGDVVGLGTGTTATFAIEEIGKQVAKGLKITAAASSKRTEDLAKSYGIQMLDLQTLGSIDISIDGADEFTESLNLIKGGGGALFREKIIASLSKNRIIVTDASKKVAQLGAFKVPIEVIPLALQYVMDQVAKLNGTSTLRLLNQKPFITDNGNFIIDADFGLIAQAEHLAEALNQIDGLLAHGLFIGLTNKVIMAGGNGVVVFE
ncbi:ribose 5-phosphate isomerase A [Pedobacter yonginense]|uniref:Ribose-5-phosphate isomerase A n=1 Tax=Pedobacter yonginense TaxID=651869 RepID=A0A317ENM1_9SPHI|nr:ribose-5-phosphate isomerase RpiA [Pedobacter yonginense]PWS26896.1 ribose 5-phosphate isomerase A [Pedobacter yonginense]